MHAVLKMPHKGNKESMPKKTTKKTDRGVVAKKSRIDVPLVAALRDLDVFFCIQNKNNMLWFYPPTGLGKRRVKHSDATRPFCLQLASHSKCFQWALSQTDLFGQCK